MAELDGLRAITVQQPWAELIASGVKPVENRPRRWGYVGRVAIHAGRTVDDDARFDTLVRRHLGPRPTVPDPARGVILAVAELVGCHPADGCCTPWGRTAPGTFHLELSGVVRLAQAVPARGMLGLWRAPDDVAAEVLRQVGAPR